MEQPGFAAAQFDHQVFGVLELAGGGELDRGGVDELQAVEIDDAGAEGVGFELCLHQAGFEIGDAGIFRRGGRGLVGHAVSVSMRARSVGMSWTP